MIYGVDIASWQGYPNFALLKEEGHEFMITKVTGEGDYINPYWRKNVDNALDAKFLAGTYDWVEPQSPTLTGALAARDYLRVVGERKPGHLLCVDFETPDWFKGALGRAIEPWMREYMYTLRDMAKQPVIVYTAKYFLEETGAVGWDWLGKDFLYWQAAPGPNAMMPDDSFWPATTPPFAVTLIHQHQWHATSTAVVGEFDRNRFQGTREQLAAYGLAGAVVGPGHEPGPGQTVAYVNAKGETIVASNYGGEAVEVLGHVTVDQGVSVKNAKGEIYDQSQQADVFQGWRQRRAS